MDGEADARRRQRKVLEHVVAEIWEELRALHVASRIAVQNRLYIWQDEDHPPTGIPKGEVLIGQRPNVRHLREGFFAPRQRLYADLSEELRSWLTQASGDRLRMFWLAGRSGSGKSVTLLHLLASLHEDGSGPIIWLGHRVNQLSDAFAAALRLSLPHSSPIIGVDDPFVPGDEQELARQWERVFSIFHPQQQVGTSAGAPVFIVCGPTEQAHAYQEQFGDELDLRIVTLPNESPDIGSLRSWYTLRTDRSPPEEIGDNSLLVQLFFEWSKHESLFDFSKRMRDRLLGADVTGALLRRVSCVLALNRLYVGYPIAAIKQGLTPAQLDQLSILEKELHLGERSDAAEPGYWLLHAHLANAIYENWHSCRYAERTDHLLTGTCAALQWERSPQDRTRPLWTLISVWLGAASQQRATRSEVEDVFKNTYNALSDLGLNPMPLWLIPAWVAISLQVPIFPSRAQIVEQALSALDRTNLTETGLRLCCHKLIQYFYSLAENDRASVVNRLHTLLTHTEWFGWQWIANDVIRRNISPTLRAVILRGIKAFDSGEPALRICRTVLTVNPTSDERETIAQLLRRAPPTVEWADVAKSLIDDDKPSVTEAAQGWLMRHHDSPEIVFCLGSGLHTHYWKLRETGMQWARQWRTLENANYVLEPLMSGTPQDEEVLEWCKGWISVTRHDSSFMLAHIIRLRPDLAWPTECVFQSLLRTVALGTSAKRLIDSIAEDPARAPSFAQVCREWIDRASISDPHWPRVWHAYRSTAHEKNELSELGLSWLKQASAGHAEWSNIWNELWDSAFHAADLISLAQNWLRNVLVDNQTWGFLWRAVWEAGMETPEMQNLAIRWLAAADPRNAAWSHVWMKLIAIPTLAEQLKAQGIEWLRAVPATGRSWSIVWGLLGDPRLPDTKLAELGLEYLQRSMRHFESWARIWGTLWRWRFEREQLIGLGTLWLDASLQRDNTHWPFVFSTLAKSSVTHELAQLGVNWLASAAAANTGWNHVWQPLFNSEPRPPEVNRLGLEWLHATKFEDHSGWAQVWVSLRKDSPDSPELNELGYRWMAAHFTSPQWVHVWCALCGTFDQESATSRAHLSTIGRRRLQQTSEKLGEWGQIWKLLIKLMPKDRSLIAIGLRLVQKTHSNSINWSLVWHMLMKFPEHKPLLLDLARSWLLRHRAYPVDWHEVWFTSSRERPLNSQEINKGLHWLGRRSSFRASHWAEIWDVVAQRRQNDRKVALYAREWM